MLVKPCLACWSRALSATVGTTSFGMLLGVCLWILGEGPLLLGPSGLTSGQVQASDILLPFVEPRLPIEIRAKRGTKMMRGAYEVIVLHDDCSVQQGRFLASGQRIEIWLDRFPQPEEQETFSRQAGATPASGEQRWMYKAIVRVDGLAAIRIDDDQKLEDHSWTGRLYSYREPSIDVGRWETQATDEPGMEARPADGHRRAETDRPPPSAVFARESIGTPAGDPVTPAQFEAIAPAPAESRIPAPEDIRPMVLPPQPTPGDRQGSLIDPASNPLGGLILDGDVQANLPPTETTSLQPSAPSFNPTVPPGSPGIAQGPATSLNPTRVGAQSFEFSGRGGVDPELRTIPRPETGDSLIAISRGIRLKFGGASVLTSSGPMDLGTVLIEADRALIWTADFNRLMSSKIDGLPIEVYLEGNVVFQQGPRTIYADRMYYNVQSENGMVLGAEILTPAPQYEGIVRLKADVIEQRSRQSFLAYNAAVTSSRLGVPRYWLQADRLSLEDSRPSVDASSSAALLRTGTTSMEATARNNFVYLEGVPVLYWPVMTTNVDSPNFYLRSAKFKNDSIFGQQLFLDWDLYQLLGIDGPDGTDWRLSTDYLTERGFAFGTSYRYNLPRTFLPGPATGFFDAWGLSDRGLDTLGSDRVDLFPERDTRGRITLRHRQYLTPDWELWAELGMISDRNFLEQFFEREWDEEKDFATALRLRHYRDNQLLDILGQPRVNRFFTETEWLPKMEHYLLGQSFFDVFTWYAHSHVAYAHQRVASTPLNAADAAKFQLQPWEVDAEGIRAGTRQELALPVNAGPIKLVPYLNGEVMTWGEDVTGNPLTRLTGQAGIRSSLPFWRVYPEVQNRLFNVNGIAHKGAWNTEFFYGDTNKEFSQLPLYDPLDDNAQEHFRRRLVFNTFGGTLPPEFDNRSYAIRQGLQRYVTAASQEVVADQMQVRLGLDQRWQTKRGLAGRERIADLFEFDVDGILFPKAERDNFGETVGAINYDFRFHAGDRYTLLSDGYFDLFDGGLQVISGGFMITRPGRGDYYFGLTSLQGPVDSLVANSNINYRLNDKWIFNGGSTFDFGEVGNVGQSVSLVRVGESFLAQVGFSVDTGRDNASFFFNLEPRFFPFRGTGNLGGQVIPPAGLYGLE
jgi:hypothetical protein